MSTSSLSMEYDDETGQFKVEVTGTEIISPGRLRNAIGEMMLNRPVQASISAISELLQEQP